MAGFQGRALAKGDGSPGTRVVKNPGGSPGGRVDHAT